MDRKPGPPHMSPQLQPLGELENEQVVCIDELARRVDGLLVHPIRHLQKKVLDETSCLFVAPERLEFRSDYSSIAGGFGTVVVAELDQDQSKLVAVKELRLTGSIDDRARLACVSLIGIYLWVPYHYSPSAEVWKRTQGLGTSGPS